MPAWPGGPCPQCGEEMPATMVHCRMCRALLNIDLESDSVDLPAFIPLPEIDSYVELKPRGYFISCPHCDRELKVNAKYVGQRVNCVSCAGEFDLDFGNPGIDKTGFYADCPHCTQRLRVSKKYIGVKVSCKFCGEKLRFVE